MPALLSFRPEPIPRSWRSRWRSVGRAVGGPRAYQGEVESIRGSGTCRRFEGFQLASRSWRLPIQGPLNHSKVDWHGCGSPICIADRSSNFVTTVPVYSLFFISAPPVYAYLMCSPDALVISRSQGLDSIPGLSPDFPISHVT